MRIQIIGKKNSGKTTFCQELMKFLAKSGLNAWYYKHSSITHPASDLNADTGKLRLVGADMSLFESPGSFEIAGSLASSWLKEFKLQQEWNHDITLIEGLRNMAGNKFEIIAPGEFENSYFRSRSVKGIIGLISNDEIASEIPCFNRHNLTDILTYARKKWQNSFDHKRLIRRFVSHLKKQYSALDLGLKSQFICQQIAGDEGYQKARNILLYWPMPDEVDLTSLLLHSSKQQFFLPIVHEDGSMTLGEFQGKDTLEKSGMGIMEPKYSPRKESNEMDLFLIPGIAYTLIGKRLGRGGGYYDRLLKQRLPNQQVWGVGFDFQILNDVPMTEQDQAVDRVIVG